MKKFLVVGGIVVGLGLVGVLVLTFFLGNIVTAGVNNFAPKLTQTKVVLASATISPLSGSGTLRGLVVGNPKGWSDSDICSLGKIHLEVQPFSVLGDHVIINEITIEAPEFNYETKFVASNVADLLKNIEQFTGSKDATATTKGGKPIKFEVKKFRLQNGWVRVGVGPAAMKLPMPPIALDNLGTKEGGITPDQLVYAVMKNVTGSIVSATTKAVGDIGMTTGAAAADGAKKAVEGFKGLFGGKK
jgi:hypothetical protein